MNKTCDVSPKKTRILVVDDDPVNARVAARIGRFAGFDVCVTHTAHEALDIARAGSPDLIIADVVMPELDGSELCVMLKSDIETRNIPVLFVSALAGDEFAPLGEFCGGADYLAKPFTPVGFLRAINRVLGRVKEMAAA
jgi:CheY-like chemotaxis protein